MARHNSSAQSEEPDQSMGLEKENRDSQQFSFCMPNLIWGVNICAEKESGTAFKNECCDRLAMSAAVVGKGYWWYIGHIAAPL